jgi:hypothetical protein
MKEKTKYIIMHTNEKSFIELDSNREIKKERKKIRKIILKQ